MSGNPQIKRAKPGGKNRNDGGPICQDCGLRTEDYYLDKFIKRNGTASITTFRVRCAACHEDSVRRETRENS